MWLGPGEPFAKRRALPGCNFCGQVAAHVLPNHQHASPRRIALVADVGRHGSYVAGLHDDACPSPAIRGVLDIPNESRRLTE